MAADTCTARWRRLVVGLQRYLPDGHPLRLERVRPVDGRAASEAFHRDGRFLPFGHFAPVDVELHDSPRAAADTFGPGGDGPDRIAALVAARDSYAKSWYTRLPGRVSSQSSVHGARLERTAESGVELHDTLRHYAELRDGRAHYDDDRAALHRTIARTMLRRRSAAPAGATPQALIVIGPVGAGKTTATAEWRKRILAYGGSDELTEITADAAKEMLPEYNGGLGNNIVHEESSGIAEDAAMRRAIAGRHNVAFDTTGRHQDRLRDDYIEALAEAGYEVTLVCVTVAPETSVTRARSRALVEGRAVPEGYVRSLFDGEGVSASEKTFHALAGHPAVTRSVLLDNEVEPGEPATVVVAAGWEDLDS